MMTYLGANDCPRCVGRCADAAPVARWRLATVPSRLEEKPDPLLAFVDPTLEKARAGEIALLVAERVRRDLVPLSGPIP